MDQEYYHVAAEIKPQYRGDKPHLAYAFDLSKDQVINSIIRPKLSGLSFTIDGIKAVEKDVIQMKVFQSLEKIGVILARLNRGIPAGLIMSYTKADALDDGSVMDVTQQINDEVEGTMDLSNSVQSKSLVTTKLNNVFIIYGHNKGRETEVENFLRILGFNPIALGNEADQGNTIIEKIESYAPKAVYAIVIYTPDDIGYLQGKMAEQKPRARQNVIFEHGYLMAKLGRNKTSFLVDGSIEIPSDIDGMIFEKFEDGRWQLQLARNMANSGMDVDFNKLK